MNTRKPRQLILVCLLLGAMMLAVSHETAKSTASVSALPAVIEIGYLVPLSGGLGAYGPGMQEGAELVEWVVNTKWGGIAREGLANATIDILVRDTATDPTTTAAAATSLITVNNVEVIVGAAGSSNTLAAVGVTSPAKVVLISYASTSPAITTQGGAYTFRVVGSDSLQGWALADVALELGYEKAVMLYQDNAYGLGMAEVFETKFEAGGGTIVEDIAYVETATSFSTELNTIKTLEDADSIDVIMDVSYADDGAIIFTEAATLGITTPWVCAEGVADATIFAVTTGVGAAMTGMWGTKPYSNTTTGEYQQFLSYFNEHYPTSTVGIYADYSYDAVMIVVDAIIAAGEYDGTAIKNALQTVSQGWKGATGDKSFDTNGDVGQDYNVWWVTENTTATPTTYEFTIQGMWTRAGGADFVIPDTETGEDGLPGFGVLVVLITLGISIPLVVQRRRRQ